LFFLLSKTFGVLVLPTNLLIIAAVTGVLLLRTQFVSLGRKLVTASILLLVICGVSPLGNVLLYPLEQRFPPWNAANGAPDGIVVLGGSIDADLSAERGTAVFSRAADRVIVAAELARRYPKARLIFTGGSANLLETDAKEADYVVAVFEALGIPGQRLEIDRRARNTDENAEFSKAIAAPKSGQRWLLLTSAFHMPRSVGIFRKAGFAVEPYPVDWRTGGAVDLLTFSPFVVQGLERTDIAVREWIGLVAYWISGKTSALFPAPMPR
jgi:uncharacterized SAM-binding protein YcdF (DUF218 family)